MRYRSFYAHPDEKEDVSKVMRLDDNLCVLIDIFVRGTTDPYADTSKGACFVA